jgi:hypothetical protein
MDFLSFALELPTGKSGRKVLATHILKKENYGTGVVVHICNHNLATRDMRIRIQSQPGQKKKLVRPYIKK